jgi:hypothetical protein
MLQIEFWTVNGTVYCTSPEHIGVLTKQMIATLGHVAFFLVQ